MNIFERFADLKARMTEWLADAQAEVDAIRDVDEAMHRVPTQRPEPMPEIPAPLPPPALVTPGTVEVPPPVASAVPVGGDREIPDEIWPVIDAECAAVGLDPDVLLAIEIWETGWFTSDAWRGRRNPGGMKNAPAQFAGKVVTDRDPEKPTYLRFRSWQEGIKGHALFIGLGPRYNAVRTVSGPLAQLAAIGAAGYAEGSESWLAGVSAKHAQVVKLRAAREGEPVVPGDLGKIALSFVGEPIDYDPLTLNGRLGCANAASTMMIKAGVIDKIILGVDDLADHLKSKGWKAVPPPYRSGDVPVIEKPPPQGPDEHKHIGILAEKDGRLVFVNNHGSVPEIGVDDWASYSRKAEEVLRGP